MSSKPKAKAKVAAEMKKVEEDVKKVGSGIKADVKKLKKK